MVPLISYSSYSDVRRRIRLCIIYLQYSCVGLTFMPLVIVLILNRKWFLRPDRMLHRDH